MYFLVDFLPYYYLPSEFPTPFFSSEEMFEFLTFSFGCCCFCVAPVADFKILPFSYLNIYNKTKNDCYTENRKYLHHVQRKRDKNKKTKKIQARNDIYSYI